MTILLIIIGQGLVCWALYDLGYAVRERRFQKNPIIFVIGVENSMRADNSGAKTKVVVYNKKLVDIEFIKSK